MASSTNLEQGETTPHGSSTVVHKFNATCYGPLTDYQANDKHYSNFRGGSYILTTPSNDGMMLYRRYGGPRAGRDGQYWLVESREGNLSLRMDAAVPKEWGNDLSKEVKIVVPKGLLLIEGYAAAQNPHSAYGRTSNEYGFLGGGWQVFIPRAVVQALLGATDAIQAQKRDEANKCFAAAFDAQKSFMEQYDRELRQRTNERMQAFCSEKKAMDLLRSGNALSRLTPDVRRALTTAQSGKLATSGSSSVPCGSYLVHSESITLPDGSTASLSLHVRLEFSHETSRTYQSGNTIITEVTKHYNLIFEWK